MVKKMDQVHCLDLPKVVELITVKGQVKMEVEDLVKMNHQLEL